MKQTPAERNYDLLEANTRYLLRARQAEELLRKIYEQSRVGYGNGKPVTRSKRVNYPAHLWYETGDLLKEPWK